jgi:hypothetical protein
MSALPLSSAGAEHSNARHVENGMTKRDKYLTKKYGITEEEYEEMLRVQRGGCWICGSTPKKRRLHVDHSHATGVVRGLLCHRCNRGLQWFSDDWVRLQKAAEYLRHT